MRNRKAVLGWVITLGVTILTEYLSDLFASFSLVALLLDVCLVLSLTLFTLFTFYLVGSLIRFVLTRLFWSVGRRLALSYALIGLLPFIFSAVLTLFVGYIGLGVMSQTSFRAARQQMVNRMEEANLEYVLTSVPPSDLTSGLEIYDNRANTIDEIPPWLRTGSFSGPVDRDGGMVLVSSKTYAIEDDRRIVAFVLPMDETWSELLRERSGIRSASFRMIERGGGYTIDSEGEESGFERIFGEALSLQAVGWIDFTPPVLSWETGESTEAQILFVIANPYSNLARFYFGSSSRYLDSLLVAVMSLILTLAGIYVIAMMVAISMIWSITRAVNRIERGTMAVEQGNFDYTIGMRPTSQLGDVATSFDRMTASISSLLEGVAERERLQSEIEIAASIQRNLLPLEGPDIRGISFSAHFDPTASIGGDYYDVFQLSNTQLAVAIGDVSGHGLSTGLVMAMVKAAITTLVEENMDEEALFRRLNSLVYNSTERRAFMTLGFTVFDLEKRTVRHTNAGHLYPYILRTGESPEAIEVPSLPLGIRAEIEPHTETTQLKEGDTVVYLSDGIVEALDPDKEQFGFDRLERTIAFLAGEEPDVVRESILSAVADHGRGIVADDDQTIMILRFESLDAFRFDREESALPG